MTQQNQSPVVTDGPVRAAAEFLTAIARASNLSKALCEEADAHASALEAALSSGVRDALEWYREQAAAARRFMADKEANADALLAILTALSLDGGRRAEAAIEPTQAPHHDAHQIAAKDAEIDLLTRERNEARQFSIDRATKAREFEERAQAAEARVAELEKALEELKNQAAHVSLGYKSRFPDISDAIDELMRVANQAGRALHPEREG